MTQPTITLTRTPANLDDALFSASCFAGASPRNAVTIWGRISGEDEFYRVIDAGAETPDPSEGWSPVYTLTAYPRRAD